MRAAALLVLALLPLGALAQEAPRRIAALAPHAVEMLFLLGVGDRIVATVDHADHPPAARAIPRIGDAFSLSLEALVATRPDLVVAWGSTLDGQRRARLETVVPELFVSEPGDLDGVADELDRLAARLGRGRGAADAFRRRLEALPEPGGEAVRVLPLVSLAPPTTLGPGSFVDDVLRRCGAVNPLAGDGPVVVPLSREVLLTVDLDHVLPMVDDGPAAVAALFAGPVRALDVDPDLLARPGPRLLEGAERLCALLGTDT